MRSFEGFAQGRLHISYVGPRVASSGETKHYMGAREERCFELLGEAPFAAREV